MRDRYSGRQVAVTAVLLLAVVAAVGVLSAPAAAQDDGERIDSNFTVTEDGEISEFEYRYEMNQGTYESFQDQYGDEYADPAVGFAEEIVGALDAYGGYRTAETRLTASGAVMTVVFTDIDVSGIDDTTVSVSDDRVSMVREGLDDPAASENLTEAYYRYEMPGTVVSTNADDVDGRTAIWRLHQNYQSTLRVESDRGGSTDQQGSEGWDVTYDIFVDGEGDIAETRIGVDVDSETHQEFESAAASEDYTTGAEWFANTFVSQNEEFVGVIDTSEEPTARGTRMVMRLETDVGAAENVSTAVRDGTVSVRHVEIDDPATQSSIGTITYRYHMPGDVVDSNADQVSGNVAIWQIHQNYQSTLTVSSTGGADTGTDDGQRQQESDGLDIAFNFTVTEDGNLSTGDVSVDLTDSTYQEFQAVTEQEEFDSVSAAIADGLVQSEEAFVGYSNAADVDSEKGTRLTFDVEINTSASENATVSAENGSVSVAFRNIDDPAEDEGVDTVTYRFEMPGEITETNAIETNGTTAIFRLHEEAPSELRVVSRTSSSTGASSSADSDDDGGLGEVGPGFGVTAALVAVVVAALALARRE